MQMCGLCIHVQCAALIGPYLYSSLSGVRQAPNKNGKPVTFTVMTLNLKLHDFLTSKPQHEGEQGSQTQESAYIFAKF